MPEIIIFHGLFGEKTNWRSIARQIPLHTTLVDLPNHGESVHTSDPMTYEVMAKTMVEKIGLRSDNPRILLGHSMGGKLAMRIALLFPERVQALIVVDIAPKKYPAIHDDIFSGLEVISQKEITSRSEADIILQKYEPNPEIRSFLLKNLIKNDDGFYRWKFNLPVIRAHYPHILDWPDTTLQFPGPSLFIKGGQSPYIADGDDILLRGLFPAVEIHTIMKAGHWLHVQALQEFLSCLCKFLSW